MRIGLYAMPSAGKTYILDRIDFIDVLSGSSLLREFAPDFDRLSRGGRNSVRKAAAKMLLGRNDFIMDGHYAFGDEIAFTEEDGNLYDTYIYLYIAPGTLKIRMENSEKNRKYLKYDIGEWQQNEIQALREYCHKFNKDFYVADNPPANVFNGANDIIDFIKAIRAGYSCVGFAKSCAETILHTIKADVITLLDGDKTLTVEDSSSKVMGYKTDLYDGNFYTGFQAWKQSKEFRAYTCPNLDRLPVRINQKVFCNLGECSYILTSGHERIWSYISDRLHIPFFGGIQMTADTKYYITKLLQEAGKYVTAYGDGMNDYYMLKQADKGFLVTKPDGTISRSLKNRDMEGLILV